MKNKKLFISALESLFFSWGGDPSPEVVWTGNEFLDWLESEYAVNLNIRFDEEAYDNAYNYNEVIQQIEDLL